MEALIGNVIKRLKVDCLVDMANYQTKGDGPEVLDLLIERIAFEIEKQLEYERGMLEAIKKQ